MSLDELFVDAIAEADDEERETYKAARKDLRDDPEERADMVARLAGELAG